MHVDATKGLDRLLVLRLAVKYNLHPLAIKDVFDDRTSTKVDRFGGDIVAHVDILSLAAAPPPEKRLPGEPPRVRIHRSHISIFLTGPPTCDTLLSIYQARGDRSSWLQLWHSGDVEVEAAPGGCADIWWGLMTDLQVGRGGSGGAEEGLPPMPMREEKADFLFYEVMNRIVSQYRPIAEAYAARLGWMLRTAESQDDEPTYSMQEISEVKLEIYDFVRSIRPLRILLRHFVDSPSIGACARQHLEDVRETIEAVIDDVEHLTKFAEALEGTHGRQSGKKTNDTLFGLSVLSAVVLPLQLSTGWYGMNFSTMPELNWKYGYVYFFWLQLCLLTMSCLVITSLRKGWCNGRAPRLCCCCCCRARKARR